MYVHLIDSPRDAFFQWGGRGGSPLWSHFPSDISLTQKCMLGGAEQRVMPGDQAASDKVSHQAGWQEKLTWTQGCLESQTPGA